jgi:hypothetical protein
MQDTSGGGGFYPLRTAVTRAWDAIYQLKGCTAGNFGIPSSIL